MTGSSYPAPSCWFILIFLRVTASSVADCFILFPAVPLVPLSAMHTGKGPSTRIHNNSISKKRKRTWRKISWGSRTDIWMHYGGDSNDILNSNGNSADEPLEDSVDEQQQQQQQQRILSEIATDLDADGVSVKRIDSDPDYPQTSKGTTKSVASVSASKREMMKFAIPALGIFLSSPLMSNIDNAFVGKTSGTAGLAALSPATICTDQMLYLFSFLSRATTGIVSRAYVVSKSEGPAGTIEEQEDEEEGIISARNAASTPITFAIFSGILLSIFYAIFTPSLLSALKVDPILRPASASYVYWRGSIAWAALLQSVCLSVMLATRDAMTPLKIISLAAVVNVIGDTLFCVYPLRMGTSGAAAATAFATVFSSGKMLLDLKKKRLLPQLKVPKWKDLKELLQYVGPLFIITIARLTGFVSMQRRAMTFGTQPLAAYQICANSLILFLLFGEPMSQLHQTKLPALLDRGDKEGALSTIKSVLTLSMFTSMAIGMVTFLTLTFGSGWFTSDAAVQAIVRNTAPSVSLAVMQAIMTTTLDGAMLASRDFSFIILVGLLTCFLQVSLLPRCLTLGSIFGTFTLRLASYAIAILLRVGSGSGILGNVLQGQTVVSKKIAASRKKPALEGVTSMD